MNLPTPESLQTFVLTAQKLEDDLPSLRGIERAQCLLQLADMAFTVAEVRAQLSVREEFRAAFEAADLSEHERKLDEASARLDEAAGLFEAAGQVGKQAECHARNGFYFKADGDEVAARDALEKALTLARGVGEAVVQANALLALGELDLASERTLERAVASLRTAVPLYEQAQRGSPAHAQALLLLARAEFSRERFEAARTAASAALPLFRALEHPSAVADTLFLLALVALNERDRTRGRALLEEALALFGEIGHVPGHAGCIHMLGLIALEEQRRDEGEARLREALALYEHIGDVYRVGELYRELARLASDPETRQLLALHAEAAWKTLGDFNLLVELRSEFGLGTHYPISP